MAFEWIGGPKILRGCLCLGSKIENLVEKHNPYHIFSSEGAINMKIS